MDGQRLDEIARLLGAGASRRRVIKGLAAGLLGVAAASTARSLASAQETCGVDGDGCRLLRGVENDGCCEGYVCDIDTETCQPVQEICGGAGDNCSILNADLAGCCEGYVCDSETETCVPEIVCLGEGELCLDAGIDPCCEGFTCRAETGVCEPVGGEAECETDADCFGGASGNPPICCAGVCRDIQCCIDDEDPNARCPEGTSCFEGICEEIVCGHDGDACDDSQDCCGELVCDKGTCAYPGDDDHDDKGHGDDQGYEPVTQLPSTGVADDSPGSGLIAGAALAAGAAALLAGKKLRDLASE